MDSTYMADEQRVIDLWEEHLRFEFVNRATMATMSEDNYVNWMRCRATQSEVE